MPKTKVDLSVFLPTTSTARYEDFIAAFKEVAEKHRAQDMFVTMSGPYPDDYVRGENHGQHGRVERGGTAAERKPVSEQGRRAAEDFADEGTGGSTGTGDAPAEPKRRGRPRKSAGAGTEEAGTTGGKRDGDGRGTAASGSGEDARGNEPRGADKGAGEGAGQGAGRRGRPRGSAGDQRGTGGADQVAADDWNEPSDQLDMSKGGADIGPALDDKGREEWWAKVPGDQWPDDLTPEDVDEAVIAELLTEHFEATGGKDRKLSIDVMEAATGVRALKSVPEDEFDKLARYLCKDIARYTYGLKKPGK